MEHRANLAKNHEFVLEGIDTGDGCDPEACTHEQETEETEALTPLEAAQ